MRSIIAWIRSSGTRTFLFLAVVLLSTCLSAQSGPTSALKRSFGKANLMTALAGYGWKPGLAMAATTLPTGRSVSLQVELEAGRDYVIVGATRYARSVLDVRIWRGDTVLAEDLADDDSPLVQFTPDTPGSYRLEVYLRAADDAELPVALSILQRGGPVLATEAFRSVERAFAEGSDALMQVAGDLRWLSGKDGWSVLGIVQDDAAPQQLNGLAFGVGEYLFSLTGWSASANSGLYLADEAGLVLADSGQPTPYPIVEASVAKAGRYVLRIEPREIMSQPLLLLGLMRK